MKVIRRNQNNKNKLLIAVVVSSVTLIILAFLVFFFSEKIMPFFVKDDGGSINNTASQTDTDTSSDSESETDTSSDKPEIPKLEYAENAEGFFGDDNEKVYIFDNVAYEVFYGTDSTAQNYIDTLNSAAESLKKELGADTKIYSMVIPNRAEFTLPDKFKARAYTNSQLKNLQFISSKLNKNIATIDIYDNLMLHRNEYIFYNTERFWTQLGAYYGYECFAEKAGINKYSLDELKKNTKSVDDYLGSLATNVKDSSVKNAYKTISKNPDKVEYYDIPTECSVKITNSDNETFDASLYYPYPSKYYAYAVFLWDSNPLTVIKTNNNTGRKLLVIKDDAANTLIPLLTSGYDEIYAVDYRYYDKKVIDMCKENSIGEVLFANGIMPANTGYLVEYIKKLF